VRVLGRAVPLWAALLTMYALSRLVSTGMLGLALALPHQRPAGYPAFEPGVEGFVRSWDSLWYERIALHGYPAHLPIGADGHVLPNPWAFFPVFPALSRLLMEVTGLPFWIAGPALATVAGGAAVFALHRVVRLRFGSRAAWWASVLFAFGPMAWLLQLGYTESLFLFLLFSAIAAMMRRRYLVMLPFAILASFTHPGALALGAALVIKAAVRLFRRHPIRPRHWVGGNLVTLLVVLSGLAWPAIAGAVTGDPTAYFDTEFAWWADFIGRVPLIPFSPAFLLYGRLFGIWGVLLVGWFLALFVLFMIGREGRRLGTDLWAFVFSYVGYLAAVFLPTQSLFRMMMPLAPVYGHPIFTGAAWRRWTTFGVGVALQLPAIELLWVVYPP
jgi:hypothetical protein